MRRNVSVTVLVRVARLAAAIATSVLTARALGATGRGEYFVVVTVSSLIVQFGHVGLASSNVYQVARDPGLLGRLLANSLWVSVGVGGAISFVVIAALSTFRPLEIDPKLLWLVLGLAPASLFFLLGGALLIGVERIVAYNIVDLAANFLVVLLIAAAALLGAGVGGILAASVAAWSVAAAGMYFVLRRHGPVATRFDMGVFRSGLRYAAKAYLVTLLGLLVLRGNTFVVQAFAGSAAVGQLSIALQFADVVGIIPTSVALVLFPRLAREGRSGWSTAVRSSLVVGLAVAGACILGGLLAGALIPAVFGRDFEASVGILLALLPGIVFLAMSTVLSQFITAAGLPRSLVFAWVAAFALVFILGIATIPAYSGIGAAASLSVTYAVLYVLVVFIGRRTAGATP